MPASQIFQAPILLTDAQIKALPTVGGGVDLVPAPGAGKALAYVAAFLYLNAAGGAYTNIDSYVYQFLLRSGEGGLIQATGEWSTDFFGATERWCQMITYAIPDGNDPPLINITQGTSTSSDIVNKPLTLVAPNDLGAFTGGNAANSLTGTISYTIIDV